MSRAENLSATVFRAGCALPVEGLIGITNLEAFRKTAECTGVFPDTPC